MPAEIEIAAGPLSSLDELCQVGLGGLRPGIPEGVYWTKGQAKKEICPKRLDFLYGFAG
jgi:hypothetical protein